LLYSKLTVFFEENSYESSSYDKRF
jgi:hypothetical protein